jgi:hypothetical protein
MDKSFHERPITGVKITNGRKNPRMMNQMS